MTRIRAQVSSEKAFLGPRLLLVVAATTGGMGCEAVLGQSGGGDGAGAGASGAIGDGDVIKPEPMMPEGSPVRVEDVCQGEEPGVAIVPLRRLTRREYENTVSQIFGVVPEITQSFVPDDGASAFASNNVSPVTTLHLEQYHAAAEAIASAYLPNEDLVASCEQLDAACGEGALRTLGRRVFRRPLTDEEVSAYRDALSEKLKRSDFWGAVGLGLRALLASPSFLYRPEIPPSGVDVTPLDDFELATRLSFTLWGASPDEELLLAAEQGALATEEGLLAQAERLLDDERAHDSVASFHAQWLGIHHLDSVAKDEVLYPDYDSELRGAMIHETELFTASLFEQAGTFSDLLSSRRSFANDRLAGLYGVTGPGEEFVEVTLPEEQRAGILTQASVLSSHSLAVEGSPILRGKFVRQNIFCQGIPEPPPGLDVSPPESDPELTTKERFAQHREDPSCSACHEMMDPIGFGFQHYDAIGAWTDLDGKRPVDATGELLLTDSDGAFDGALELSERIAASEQAQQCYVRQWFRFATGRVERVEELCSIARAHEGAEAQSLGLRSIITQLVLSDAFRFKAASGEGAEL